MTMDVFQPLVTTVMAKLPAIVAAIAVLLVGWLVAKVASRLAGKAALALMGTSAVRGLVDDPNQSRAVRFVRTLVYYLLMLFVLVFVLEVLGVSAVMGPFLAMANELTLAIPNLLKAGLILLAAWAVATVLRGIVVRLTGHRLVTGLLDKAGATEGEENQRKAVAAAGNLVYYLVFLMFLPAVLGALALEGLRQPFENLLTQVLAVLPGLMAAALTVLVGYLVARVVQGIVTHFLATAGVDQLPARVGLEQVFEAAPLSRVAGTIVFVLTLIPTVISGIESLGLRALSGPAVSMLTMVLNLLPSVVAAVLILALGIALARWVGNLTTSLIVNTSLARFLVQWGVLKAEQAEQAVPAAVGRVVAGVLTLVVLVEVLDLLHLSAFSLILRDLLNYLPHVVIAMVILAAGWGVGNFAQRSLGAMLQDTPYPAWLSLLAKGAILTLAGMMALEQLGVARSIVVTAFTILLGSAGLAAALAVGLGAREFVQRRLDRYDQR